MCEWKKILTTSQLTPFNTDLYTCDNNVLGTLKESLIGIRFEDLKLFSTENEYKMRRHLQMGQFRGVAKLLERCQCEGEE